MGDIIGFTASRIPRLYTLDGYVEEVNRVVKRLKADGFVTGACVGGDEFIALAIRRFHRRTPHTVVVPWLQRYVSGRAIEAATEVVRMPPQSSYRQRNVQIVDRSTRMVAFWTERKAHSGTYMTINIARRAGKIRDADIYSV